MKKNLFLTLWLMAPIAVVTLLCVWIFSSFQTGPQMNPQAVGAGGNDTGGANAFGEWLAGNDPDEVQRLKRELREGRLLDPLEWAAGIELVVQTETDAGPPTVMFFHTDNALGDLEATVLEPAEPGLWRILLLPEDWARGQNVVVVPAGGSIEEHEGVVVALDKDSQALSPLSFGLVPNEPPRDTELPIVFDLDLTSPRVTTESPSNPGG